MNLSSENGRRMPGAAAATMADLSCLGKLDSQARKFRCSSRRTGPAPVAGPQNFVGDLLAEVKAVLRSGDCGHGTSLCCWHRAFRVAADLPAVTAIGDHFLIGPLLRAIAGDSQFLLLARTPWPG